MSKERHLTDIGKSLDSLEYFCETEIIGDDSRHLLDDIKAAQREHLRTRSAPLKDLDELKSLYDRLKRINSSLKVMRNTISMCERAMNSALDSCDHLAENIEDSNPSKDDSEI